MTAPSGAPSLTARLMFESGATFRTVQCFSADRLPCPAFLTTGGIAGPVFDTLLDVSNTPQAVTVTGTRTQETRDGLPVIMVTSATPVTPPTAVMQAVPPAEMNLNPAFDALPPGTPATLVGTFDPQRGTVRTEATGAMGRTWILAIPVACNAIIDALQATQAMSGGGFPRMEFTGRVRANRVFCVTGIRQARESFIRGSAMGVVVPATCDENACLGRVPFMQDVRERRRALIGRPEPSLPRGPGMRLPPGGRPPITGSPGRWDNEPRVTMEGFVVSTPDDMGTLLLRSHMGDFPLMPMNALAAQTLAMFANCGQPARMTGATQDGVMLVNFVWPPRR